MTDQKIVMYDSPEAATRVDMPGWKSRGGLFYPGDNESSEHGARWSGCTHQTCECGKPYVKGRVRCDSCQAKVDTDKYYALPVIEWDEVTPVCDYGSDNYYFDMDTVLDVLHDAQEDAKKRGEDPEVRLVICEPHYLHMIEGSDWYDDLADDGDGELPDEVCKAIDAFNEVIKAQGPSCWEAGKKRINLEPLWAELKVDLAKEKDTIDKASAGVQ